MITSKLICLKTHIPSIFYDVVTSVIILSIGIYLNLVPSLFEKYSTLYKGFLVFSTQSYWSLFFIMSGCISLTVTIWKDKIFYVHLLSRMLIAFCLLIITFNNLLLLPPPLSTITYIILSFASLIGIIRIKSTYG